MWTFSCTASKSRCLTPVHLLCVSPHLETNTHQPNAHRKVYRQKDRQTDSQRTERSSNLSSAGGNVDVHDAAVRSFRSREEESIFPMNRPTSTFQCLLHHRLRLDGILYCRKSVVYGGPSETEYSCCPSSGSNLFSS